MKNISKSVRLSEKVYNYINDYEGQGFNQKFENIILFAMEEEERLMKRLSDIDKLISIRTNELNKINHNLYKARSETERFLFAIREIENFKF